MTVAVRFGLLRGADPIAGVPVLAGTAFVLATALAFATPGASDVEALAVFFALGIVVPGLSQVALVSAVRHAGPSRTSILVGTAPLLSVLLAVALLGERFDAAVLVGTALIVVGGAVLAFDPGRPSGFRLLGVVLALLCATLFAARDNAVRRFAVDLDVSPFDAAAASLLGAMLGAAVFVAAARRRESVSLMRAAVSAFLPAGILLGVSYCTLVAGFDRGSVGTVAPFSATQSLWTVLIASVVYRRAEAIGRRTVLASVLVVCGGALIAAFR
jgi:drug/metabolite transporter (DMT)-like permease